MATVDNLQCLVLSGVTKLDAKELGRGAYGRVYAVKYCGMTCAAKEIHSILIEDVAEAEMQRTADSFIAECQQCSMLRHPNIVQFLGVYYPNAAGSVRKRLPVMVMEMMADSLTSLVKKHENIPVHIKFSIAHDVSLGLCYLHNHNPSIVHRDLSPNNVLLTTHHVAKISDLGVAKVIKADSNKTMTKAPGTLDFMAPECLSTSPVYGTPMDVFSYAGVVLHTFNQEWPSPSDQVNFDPKTRKMVALSEFERRKQYFKKLSEKAKVLRPLLKKCLDNDPAVRPNIADICERIQVSKDAYMKECSQDYITLHKELDGLTKEPKVQSSSPKKKLTAVKACYKFDSCGPNELSLREGDIIMVLEKKEDWWRGTCNGHEGWFPGSYVEEISFDAPSGEIAEIPTNVPDIIMVSGSVTAASDSCIKKPKSVSSPYVEFEELELPATINRNDEPSTEPDFSFKSEPWYHGKSRRIDLEKWLFTLQLQTGDYLVRDSESSAGNFTLSVKQKDEIKSYKIFLVSNGYAIGRRKFNTMQGLVSHYRCKAPIRRSPSGDIYLGNGIPRQQ